MNHKIPELTVGIVSAEEIKVHFNGTFEDASGASLTGSHTFTIDSPEQDYKPVSEGATFTLRGVIIGIDFHWEQAEDQTFSGALRIARNPNKPNELYAINIVDTEEYLMSVISSEMRGTANMPLLKAHAVISRSWVLAQLDTYELAKGEQLPPSDPELTWYDKEDHTIFDVCADDHCQRYQGLTRDVTEQAREAVMSTRGEVLTADEGGLVDARFHKCCGGILERFESCWGDTSYNYLQPVRDDAEGGLADVSEERAAQEFILGRPDSFCNTSDQKILEQVLNSYDQTTTDFYRWTVEYSAQELRTLLTKKSGRDLGEILAIEPILRGPSGRIYKLKIRGTEGEMIVGKELEVRRLLSESHLYSSAFVVETKDNEQGRPTHFTLKGAGWGHGVGLCQIGAAVMGEKGYSYEEILLHYYPNTELKKIYE
ncbi:MAG: SpoIID/LytB domain-containing protein [Porphyromonas sp.]|nr:SpoIID/LytB domain-containing protein [Porphyromonas sp.]